jgi:hypothetical protein
MGSRSLYFCIIFYFLISIQSFSQESPGIIQGNYAGSAMARINPSTMLQSKNYMDFSIVSITAFGQNDFAYLPGKDINVIPLVTGKEDFPSYPPKDNNFLYFRNKNAKTASTLANVYGPGGMIQIGEQVFAFHTAVRSYNTARNLPYEIPIFGAESLGYEELHNINFIDYKFSSASLSWAEFGFSYARTILQQNNNHWAAGITVNRLQGFGAAFMKAQNIDYIVLNRNTIQINEMNVDAGFSLPVDYQSNTLPFGSLFKGGGFGFDLGVTYTRRFDGFQRNRLSRICEEPYKDYKWRAGVSILDLGSISFKENAEVHQFTDVKNVLLENIDKINFTNLDQLMQELSTRLTGSATASYTGDAFRIGLPTALSAQVDYHISPDWYLNGVIVHPFSLSKYSVRRPAQIAITPRYEKAWFELLAPVSLYEYRTLRIGLALRLGILTLGTDQLGTLVGLGKIQGMDFYASVKINFRKGICLFGNDNGACSSDYNFKTRRIKIHKLR